MPPKSPGKLLLRAGTANELQPPKQGPAASRPRNWAAGSWGYRRRSLSQDETGKSNKAWGSLTSTSAQTPSSSRASPTSSSRADSDLDFGLTRPVPALGCRSESLDRIASQPASALTPCAVEQCAKAFQEFGIASDQFKSKLASALLFFRFFRDLPPTTFSDVLSSARVQAFPEGRVLFKQGDPPGACYLILSGYVGIYVEAHQLQLSVPERPPSRPKKMREHRRRSKSMFSTSPDPVAPDLEYQQTAEGYCHRAEEMSLGRFCDTVSAGRLIGEIGFHGDKERRPLSAKCLEDTLCIVISKDNYVKARRDEAKRVEEERLAFLGEHLPGMREALAAGSAEKTSPKSKVSSPLAFRQATYSKGHVLLKQGEVAEDITYVVVNGFVEFQRHELMGPQPSLVPGLRPGSAPEKSGPGRTCAGTANEEGEKKGEGRRREITRRVGSLARGGVIGSMALLGEVEPFSVVAESATLEVLYINAEAKLRLPRVVAEMLKEYVSRSTMFRLGNLRVNRGVDLKRKQTRVAPSFPLLGSLFPTPSKDWAMMSKVSHASEVEDSPETKMLALARSRLGSASSPALGKESRLRGKVS